MPDNLTIADAEGIDPLTFFYLRAGTPELKYESVVGEEMPEPYRSLLVHDDDMTPTLERYYDERMYLYVLDQDRDNKTCAREVVLLGEESERRVEFGAIYINMGPLPIAARNEVTRGHTPFGTILADYGITHRCSPKAYCKFEADDTIKRALELDAEQHHFLYGRRNQLFMPDEELLAEVVEILHP